MNPGQPHRFSGVPPTALDGFEELAQAIWPTVASDSPLAAHQTRLRSVLAELMRRASTGIGSLPLTEAGLNADERTALEHWPDCIAIEGSALVLPRYAQQLREIRSFVEARLGSQGPRLADAEVAGHLGQILPPQRITGTGSGSVQTHFDNAQQRLAIAALVDARVGVLTGGPGTGKTTTAAVLLAVRHRIDAALTPDQVLVAAPTGRAASRIGEAITQSAARLTGLDDSDRAFLKGIATVTLHRALEWGPEPPERGGPYRRNALRPLRVRVMLVDEASMVDLSLMHALIRALPPEASLLLLGDSDQLESVDVGGILSEFVQRAGKNRILPEALRDRLAARLGIPGQQVQADYDQGLPHLPSESDGGALPGLVVGLRHSWRAMNAPWILDLAERVRPGGSESRDSVEECFDRHASASEPVLTWHRESPERSRRIFCQERWKSWGDLARTWTNLYHDSEPEADSLSHTRSEALQHLGRFQLLCSTNHQVERANQAGTALLWSKGSRPPNELPHGCPVLVLANQRSLGLSNGDIGIALGPIPGGPATLVLFPGADGIPRLIPRVRLPAHQPAFGLTIHKSQGSEWDSVALELPSNADSRLLSRNLLYTGITRSRRVLDLFGTPESLDLVLKASPQGNLSNLGRSPR
jgi:exodeoxyribonuclease V alpha subunit